MKLKNMNINNSKEKMMEQTNRKYIAIIAFLRKFLSVFFSLFFNIYILKIVNNDMNFIQYTQLY